MKTKKYITPNNEDCIKCVIMLKLKRILSSNYFLTNCFGWENETIIDGYNYANIINEIKKLIKELDYKQAKS